jgi:hypothetical protein
MSEVRNGTDGWYRHALARKSLISFGLREVADAGCWWLIDILCTEYADKLLADDKANRIDGTPTIEVRVKDGKARIQMTYCDEGPTIHGNKIAYTDMPEGKYTFLAGVEDGRAMFYLLSEY